MSDKGLESRTDKEIYQHNKKTTQFLRAKILNISI